MNNPSITLQDLMLLDDPCVVFQGCRQDSDGEVLYLYLVGGFLDGRKIEPSQVEGDVMIIHAKDKTEADWLAGSGLEDSIRLMRAEGIDSSPNAGIMAGVEARKLQ
jgi:hypothetical protein